MFPMKVNGIDELHDTCKFACRIEIGLAKGFERRMVERLDAVWRERWQQDRLKSGDPHASQQVDSVRGQVSASSVDVGADHGDEGVGGLEGLEQVSGRELGMVRDRISATDFEFDPDPPCGVLGFEAHIGPGAVSEPAFELGIENATFALACPASWAMPREFILQVVG